MPPATPAARCCALAVVAAAAAAVAAAPRGGPPPDGTLDLFQHGLPAGGFPFVHAAFSARGASPCGGGGRVVVAPTASPAQAPTGCAAAWGGRARLAVAVVARGECTFHLKAVQAQAAGAAALVVVNSDDDGEDALLVAPSPPPAPGGSSGGELITIPVVVVSHRSGEELLARAGSAAAGVTARLRVAGAACRDPNASTTPVARAPAASGEANAPRFEGAAGDSPASAPGGEPSDGPHRGGRLSAWLRSPTGTAAMEVVAGDERHPTLRPAPAPPSMTMEFLSGAPLGGVGAPKLRLAVAAPATACAPLSDVGPAGAALRGAAVLLTGGDCPWALKLQHVRQAGGALAVVDSTGGALLLPPPAPGDGACGGGGGGASGHPAPVDACAPTPPVVVVTAQAGRDLRRLLLGAGGDDGGGPAAAGAGASVEVSLEGAAHVAERWAELQQLAGDPAAWPRDARAARRQLARAALRHHPDGREGSAERFAVLRAAYDAHAGAAAAHGGVEA